MLELGLCVPSPIYMSPQANAAPPVTAKVALSAPQGDIRKLELVTSASAKLTLKALSGALKLWGEAGWCPFCIKGEVPIFKWKGLSWSFDLFKTELKVPLLGVQQLFPNG